ASGVLQETVRADWCPLVSYTNNLSRIRDALLDAGTAWDRVASLSEVGPRQMRSPMGMGPFGPGRRSRPGGISPPKPPPPPEEEDLPAGPGDAGSAHRRPRRSEWAPATFPWQWSAGVLAGLAAASLLVLTTRVRGLDRLR
ncbi:MAG TPA: hypothetical protein VKD72_03570, partial [Gemmataceae bacterium]|nr:hypothetical protein [Gemmataceae bacterium]